MRHHRLHSVLLKTTPFLVGLLATGCGGPPQESEPVIRPVRYQEVVASGGRRERTFSGTAQAGQESQLSFRVSGSVQSVAVSVGQNVRQGQLIARLDPTDLDLQLQQSQASLAQAEAAVRKAEADYERIRGLYENQNAAKSDLDAARAQAESARAQVKAAEQGVERSRRQLSYARLNAPVDGAIAAVRVEENENVRAGQAIAVLTSGSQPEVEVGMPEVLISQVVPGARVDVTVDALPGDILTGVVTEVGVAAMGNASTFPVVVRLDTEQKTIRSGMAANVTFRFDPEDDAERIFIPPVAVGEDRESRFVFILKASADDLATTERRSVTIGDLTPDGIEVIEGLTDGEFIVTAGIRRIQNGQTVRLQDSGVVQ